MDPSLVPNEVAIWKERYGADGKEIIEDPESGFSETALIENLLCCLRSRCINCSFVLIPSGIFLIVYLSLSASASEQVKKLFLALMLIPPVIYIFVGIGVCFIVCRRQTTHDLEDAKNAHKYLQAKRNLAKIVVTSGEKQPITGRFATFLHASRTNNTANLRWCLDDGQDPDEQDHLGRTALHWAAMTGSDEVTSILMSNGASLDLHDRLEHLTPLHYAAFYGHIKITRMLVSAGADLTQSDARKLNPLQLAEMASLKMTSVQPSHQMIIKFLRVAMKENATPPLEHITGLTVMNLVERQIMALPQMKD